MPSVLLSRSPVSAQALVPTVRDDERLRLRLLARGARGEQGQHWETGPRGPGVRGSPAIFSSDGCQCPSPDLPWRTGAPGRRGRHTSDEQSLPTHTPSTGATNQESK